VQERLQRAQETIAAAFEAQVARVQQTWLTEALERTEPILEVLRRTRTLDEAAKALGWPAHFHGTVAVHQAVVHRLQGQR
jgi:hypothetical protein